MALKMRIFAGFVSAKSVSETLFYALRLSAFNDVNLRAASVVMPKLVIIHVIIVGDDDVIISMSISAAVNETCC